MKKKFLIFIMLLIIPFALSSAPLKINDGVIGFQSNIGGRLIPSNLQFVPGLRLSVDYRTKNPINFAGYFRFEYPFSPLGNDNCGIATLEVFEEFGLAVNSIIHSFNEINKLKLYVDFGYYIQLLHLLGYETFTAGYNGIVFRPKLALVLAKLWNIPIELGLYYQLSSIPSYDRCNGLGMFLKI